jgi:folate-binding protein YgfZ
LSQRGALLVRGPDTLTFLQGQTTCDLNLLTPRRALIGAYCTAQGRLVCDFLLLGCGQDSWLMCMHRGICDSSAATFGKYIVFSNAEINNASDQWCSFAVWGDTVAPDMGLGVGERYRVIEKDGAWWVQADERGQRFECLVPASMAPAFTDTLAAKLQPAAEQAWQLAEINAGLGHVEPETVEMFIPQMLNYQLTGHISFNKGCYTGQEVVARMHYRGKLKKPMFLASLAGTPAAGTPAAGTPAAGTPAAGTPAAGTPAAGTPLYKPGSEQSIGNVVNCAPDGDTCRLLAVVTSKVRDLGVHLASPTGPLLDFHDLPYTVPAD